MDGLNDRPIRRLRACGTSPKGLRRGRPDARENAVQGFGARTPWRCSVCGRPDDPSRLVIEVGGRFPVCEDWNACADRIVSGGAP
jgi:hypothetical protein